MGSDHENVDISKFMTRLWKLKEFETSPSGALLKMLAEGLHADITIQANGGSVKAHRSVLASMSPVFSAMFKNDMREQLTSLVEFPDMSIEALEFFLFLLYSGFNDRVVKESALDEHCIELMEICHKYQVTHIVPTCAAAMERILTDENCWDHLTKTSRYFHEVPKAACMPWKGVLTKCMIYILSNFAKIVQSDSFCGVNKTYPDHVAAMINLAISARPSCNFCKNANNSDYWQRKLQAWVLEGNHVTNNGSQRRLELSPCDDPMEFTRKIL